MIKKWYVFIYLFLHFNIAAALTIKGEKPICILVCSYNNKDWYKQNLDSLFAQAATYSNFEILYINDASTDNTGSLVEEYVAAYNASGKKSASFRMMNNVSNQGQVANIFQGVNTCDNNVIIVLVDGDDWLAHDHVLQKINEVYSDTTKNVWMTYGQYREWPESSQSAGMRGGQPFPEQVVRERSYRSYPWVVSHLKTFYAGIFKTIPYHDLCDENGKPYRVGGDCAFVFSLVEKCGGHAHCEFIPEVLYVYNIHNPISDMYIRCRQKEEVCRIFRSKKSCDPLDPAFVEALLDDYWQYASFFDALQPESFARSLAMTQSVVGIEGKDLFIFFQKLYEENNPSKKKMPATLKIPKIIHQIWLGSEVPECFEPLMRSWIEKHLGRDWSYKLWTDADVPSFGLYNQSFYDQATNYGMKSDLLRWEILYRYGGVYIDMDYECLYPLDRLHYTYDFYTAIQPLDTQYLQLGAALFGSCTGHPILKHVIETIKDDWHKNGVPARTGPIHFTHSFYAVAGKTLDLTDIAFPPSYFYPQGCTQKELLYDQWKAQGAYAIHHWAKSWMPAHYRPARFKELGNDADVLTWRQ